DGSHDDLLPGAVVADRPARLVAREQGVGEGGPDRAREARGVVAEGVPGEVVGGRTDRGEARRGGLFVARVDEQPAGAAGQRRVRRVAAPRVLDVEPQIAADAIV